MGAPSSIGGFVQTNASRRSVGRDSRAATRSVRFNISGQTIGDTQFEFVVECLR